MSENYRSFEVTDPFGRVWQVEFRWQQNAISIRHADAVDCKYYISSGDQKRELVCALQQKDLLAIAAAQGREVTDAWCIALAGRHVRHLISTWTDMEKTLITVDPADLERHAASLAEAVRLERERALLSH